MEKKYKNKKQTKNNKAAIFFLRFFVNTQKAKP